MAVSNEQISQPIDLIGGLLIPSLLQPLQVLGQLPGILRRRDGGSAPAGVVAVDAGEGAGGGAPVVMQPKGAEVEVLVLGPPEQREVDEVEALEEMEEGGLGLGEGAVEVGEDEGLEEGFELHGGERG